MTSFQQCPRVDGPFSVEVLLRPHQRVVRGLANIQEIFRIHKEAGRGFAQNTSRALIERPYSCAPQAVGAVYDRPGFFVQSRRAGPNRRSMSTVHESHLTKSSQLRERRAEPVASARRERWKWCLEDEAE